MAALSINSLNKKAAGGLHIAFVFPNVQWGKSCRNMGKGSHEKQFLTEEFDHCKVPLGNKKRLTVSASLWLI
jgi:hypothetical protein